MSFLSCLRNNQVTREGFFPDSSKRDFAVKGVDPRSSFFIFFFFLSFFIYAYKGKNDFGLERSGTSKHCSAQLIVKTIPYVISSGHEQGGQLVTTSHNKSQQVTRFWFKSQQVTRFWFKSQQVTKIGSSGSPNQYEDASRRKSPDSEILLMFTQVFNIMDNLFNGRFIWA